jgi:sodium/potassium/calcium exchanger 6
MSNEFACEREYVESIFRPVQRNILIAEYCSDNFGFINLVDFYYRKTDANAILIFLFICSVYPILFMNIAAIADKYLASGMQDLSERFKLSPTLAAVTLIAFANGAPDVLSALRNSENDGGAFISLGALFGAYIFSSTLVVSNVIFNSKDEILMPKLAILKELLFYLASVVVVCIFGFIRTAGIPFVITYATLYIAYIGATLYIDKFEGGKEGITEDAFAIEHEVESPPVHGEKGNTSLSRTHEIQIKVIEDNNEEEEKNKNLFSEMVDELVEEDSSFIQNLVVMPLMLAGLFTVPYLSNPLMKTPLKVLVLTIGITFIATTLDLASLPVPVWLIISLVVSIILYVLETINFKKNALEITYELISVFAAIGWIKIFSTLIIDFITFLAFYFSINEIILSSLLLSAGNTIGDFFGNAALAKQGGALKGAIASYSGQIFNNFVGFGASIFMSPKGKNDEDDFDIFAIKYYKGDASDNDKPAPLGNYFLMCVILFVLVLIGLKLVYFPLNRYVLKKKFAYVLISIYSVFFTASLIFGLLSRQY